MYTNVLPDKLSFISPTFYIVFTIYLLRLFHISPFFTYFIIQFSNLNERIFTSFTEQQMLTLIGARQLNYSSQFHFYSPPNTTTMKIINIISRAGQNNFLPGSTTWRQKFPADQRSIFVLNLYVHKGPVIK